MTAALRLLALLQTIGSSLALVFAVCAAIVAACGYLTAYSTYPPPADEPAPEAP